MVISAHLHRTRLSQYLHLNLLALAQAWWFTSHLYRTRLRYYTPCPLRVIRVFAGKNNVREGQKTATPACGPNIYEWKGWSVMFKIPMHNFDHCDSLVFSLSSLSDFHLVWIWIWNFESLQMDLSTWVPPWRSPKWLILSSHNFFSDLPQNNIMNIFLMKNIHFLSKPLTRPLCSKATPIILAHKNLRKFPNILSTLGHLPEQKISSLFGILFLQKIFSVLDRNGSFYNYHFTCSFVAEFSCASSP